jgi:hydrogenase/urease accessory protein HupE
VLRLFAVLAACLLSTPAPAFAHPVPFSYIDVRIVPGSAGATGAIEVSVVAHAFDLSNDLGLGVDMPEQLLNLPTLEAQAPKIIALIEARLHLFADGRRISGAAWSAPERLVERNSVMVKGRFEIAAAPGLLEVRTQMFPYDPQHQTFVNIYEGETLGLQAILDSKRTSCEFFAGSRQGAVAVIRRFVPSGIHHILIGPDHLLFLVGLLLLGGTLRRLIVIVTGFTIAHSFTLSRAALNILSPPANLIEPAIALSIIYVGVDNLMVKGGRDVRAWIAFGFGFIHGFGFANVLREMDLPARALGWSLFSFNLGVEIGQLVVVVAVASFLEAVRRRSEVLGRRVAVAGSVVVVAAGAFWFIQRVFFSGGSA